MRVFYLRKMRLFACSNAVDRVFFGLKIFVFCVCFSYCVFALFMIKFIDL